MNKLADAGAALLGSTVANAARLHGGDLSHLVHVELQDGRHVVVKTGPAPHTEAAMLKVIAAAHVPAPKVLAVSDEALVLEFVPVDGRVGNAWADLGTTLARLHRVTEQRYGFVRNYAFGHLPIENGWMDDWPKFYAERRLMVHLSHIHPALARRVALLARDIHNRLPHKPPGALLHGDLWGGNVLVNGDRIAGFIDPACVFGHCEMDIAMLGLFDPIGPDFYAAYGALEPGAEARLPIYRLWPALVHLRLFGNSYRRMVEGFLSAAGV
jgi:fructosamine-3-kinase